jgi:hypothetical protein
MLGAMLGVTWNSAGVALSCGLAWTTNTPPGTWSAETSPVTFVVAAPVVTPDGDDETRGMPSPVRDALTAELDVALRTWSRPACSAFRATVSGTAPVGARDDGVNVIVVHEDVWPSELLPRAIAQTVVHVDPGGNLRDADVHLNAVDWRFSLDGRDGTVDLRSILVHELGHALGLGHSTDPRATMAPNGSGLRWRSLETDDVNGVCTLYPGSAAPGCDRIPCPGGYLCVAGACQRPGERRDVCSPCQPGPGACEAAGDRARCLDIGEGAHAGRVCGRACAADADCGVGFRCSETTEAGDRQCISLDACRSAANPCDRDADCAGAEPEPEPHSVCRGGACVGPRSDVPHGEGDGGGEPDVDAGGARGVAEASGCACRASLRGARARGAASTAALAGLLLAWLVARGRRSATRAR